MSAHIFPHMGWFGKHPAYGDFVGHGMSAVVRSSFENWLVPTLGHMRQYLGDGWQGSYDAMQPMRFWIGPAVLGTPWPLRGVVCPSRDKVGRRFPLVMLDQGGASDAPPVLDLDQTFYEAAEQMAAAALGSSADSLAALVPGAGGQAAPASDPEPAFFWAVNPDADPTALLRSAGSVDHQRAVTARSYWWTTGIEGARSTAFMGAAGMPGPDALGWLMTGVGVAPEQGADGPDVVDPTDENKQEQELDLATGDGDT